MTSIKASCRKVVCIGRNYAAHASELANPTPTSPFFFLKPPSSMLPPHSGPVLRPSGVTLHHEVELALLISAPFKDLPSTTPIATVIANYVGAYALAIDLTARNVQTHAKNRRLPWTVAKGFDTFLPISESIPKSKIPNPENVQLWLSVDGHVRQNDNTNLMLFKIPRILSEISKVMTLEPGDVVLTGTPKGVGEVKEGQIMRAGMSIDGQEIKEAYIQVKVENKGGLYKFEDLEK